MTGKEGNDATISASYERRADILCHTISAMAGTTVYIGTCPSAEPRKGRVERRLSGYEMRHEDPPDVVLTTVRKISRVVR